MPQLPLSQVALLFATTGHGEHRKPQLIRETSDAQ